MPATLLAASVHGSLRIADNLQQLLDHLVDIHKVRERPRLVQALMHLNVGVLKPGDELPSGESWEGDRCPVCYDEYESGQSVAVLHCDHVICLDCCIRSLAAKPMLRTCGMCREAIFEDEVDHQIREEEAELLGDVDDYYSDYESRYDEWSGEEDYREGESEDNARSEDDRASPVVDGGEVMMATADAGRASGNRSNPIVLGEDGDGSSRSYSDASTGQDVRRESSPSTDDDEFEDVVYGPNRRRIPLQTIDLHDGVPRHPRDLTMSPESPIDSPARPRSPTIPAASARYSTFSPGLDYGSPEFHPQSPPGNQSRGQANASASPFILSPAWYPTSPRYGSDSNDSPVERNEGIISDTRPSERKSTPTSRHMLSADDWLSQESSRDMLSTSHEDGSPGNGRKRSHQCIVESSESEEDVVYGPKRRCIVL